jgi:uncharacterized membrane protein YraQ (UPF0718 family)
MTALVAALNQGWSAARRLDGAWASFIAICLGLLALAPVELPGVLKDTVGAFLHTLPLILFAVAATAYLRASGAERVVAKAFEGREVRMIVLASLVGGLAPFCSCEVIPFIAALLAAGAPLSAVMAFWLASPIMDPPMFLITTGALGLDFAIAKTLAAVFMGLFGGFGLYAIRGASFLADPLRPSAPTGGCCSARRAFSGQPVWRFWEHDDRRQTFWAAARENLLFLGKWLALAYLIEALMIRWLPAEMVGDWLGGDGIVPIMLGALAGGPAYLNGYAAAPLVAGLMEQGMGAGAAMAFMLAGGVSCIPAAIAVFALVKRRVFALYLGFAFAGSVIAGLAFAVVA